MFSRNTVVPCCADGCHPTERGSNSKLGNRRRNAPTFREEWAWIKAVMSLEVYLLATEAF